MPKRSITAQLKKRKQALSAARHAANQGYRKLLGTSQQPQAPVTSCDPANEIPTQPVPKQGKKLVRCGHCPSMVREDRLADHIRRAHHKETRTVPTGGTSSPKASQGQQKNTPAGSSAKAPVHHKRKSGSSSAYVETTYVETDETGTVLSYHLAKRTHKGSQSKPSSKVANKRCEICGTDFPIEFIAIHYRNIHLIKKMRKDGLFQCIVCNSELKTGKVNSHRKTCHIRKSGSTVFQHLENTGDWTDDVRTDSQRSTWISERTRGGQDGGKGLGHFRRDRSNGTFGSLPLYDDYGEDSSS